MRVYLVMERYERDDGSVGDEPLVVFLDQKDAISFTAGRVSMSIIGMHVYGTDVNIENE